MDAAMDEDDFERRVARVRRFNRFYTERIRVLDESFLGSPYNLTQARVLYELASRGRTTATDIAKELELDKGYLSRMLAGMRRKGLVARGVSSKDGRKNVLWLTKKGWEAFSDLDARSRADIGGMLGDMGAKDQRRVVRDMVEVERLLSAKRKGQDGVSIRAHVPGDLGWIVSRHGALYWEEQRWDERFEALVARVVADFADAQDAAHERCWVAELGGERVGSVMITRAEDDGVAKLRLLLVEPRARGRGIGRRLMEEVLTFARAAGYRRLTLWTIKGLDAAQALYERAGFRKVHEEPLEAFGHRHTSETWELEL
jgi:DNA-binding MarR family transcriptional regulator/GNAT superfamily N-acetyltransferase